MEEVAGRVGLEVWGYGAEALEHLLVCRAMLDDATHVRFHHRQHVGRRMFGHDHVFGNLFADALRGSVAGADRHDSSAPRRVSRGG